MDLDAALTAIDTANEADPNLVATPEGPRPLALVQGRQASQWVQRLRPDATPALVLAARAHHLERWLLARSSYPEGRSGYLRWRTAQKKHHAIRLGEVLEPLGVPADVIARAQQLVQKDGLTADPARRDPDVQCFEDAVCLVFLATQFDALADRVDHDTIVNAVRKTLAKMSAAGIAAAADVALSPRAQQILADATA
jgi:hypothetical protein